LENNISHNQRKKHNRLIHEKSPYLLQHAENPVDWYPWGEAAFEKARSEDKPLFLSIGYATCHWCHVMEKESFEDEEVARLLNRYFVSVKVDREERPDIDLVYMIVCQALTGHGGWPLSIFMTPDRTPFYAGTYFPKIGRSGIMGFMDLLTQLAALWQKDRERILRAASDITQALQPRSEEAASAPALGLETLKKGYEHLARSYDPKWGGFGEAPKFPAPHQLMFLLRWHLRSGDSFTKEMVKKTLDAMRNGGIFDQIGYGFHRYSVDAEWLVPHFEKMLYDQALLTMAYTEAYQSLGHARFAQTAREILTYVLRDMTAPEGGFYSAEDADSEGVEGRFYVWRPEEVKEHLGPELGDLFCRFYGIREGGNFEDGYSIPHVAANIQTFAAHEGMEQRELERVLKGAVGRLYEAREKRVHPLKDDKILTSWNGLMIAALAKAAQALGDPSYGEAADRAARFILNNLRGADGRLFRRYRQGHVAHPGYLEDYAFLVWGLLELYETTFALDYLEEALALNATMIDLFWDEEGGGLYFTGEGNEPLITRNKEVYDGALPSGNSVAALNFLRLSRMSGDTDLEKRAEQLFRAFAQQVSAFPKAHTQFLNAVDFVVGPTREIVLVGAPLLEDTQAMVEVVHRSFLPNKVLMLSPGGSDSQRLSILAPFTASFNQGGDKPVAYVCEQFSCKAPVMDAASLYSLLQ
jgi:uncharacterized protein YyaL (SSP411 family)